MINLNECVEGQMLRSRHGEILTYVRKLSKENHYEHFEHLIRHSSGNWGFRTDDGFVFKNEKNRLPTDDDIVEILPLEKTKMKTNNCDLLEKIKEALDDKAIKVYLSVPDIPFKAFLNNNNETNCSRRAYLNLAGARSDRDLLFILLNVQIKAIDRPRLVITLKLCKEVFDVWSELDSQTIDTLDKKNVELLSGFESAASFCWNGQIIKVYLG